MASMRKDGKPKAAVPPPPPPKNPIKNMPGNKKPTFRNSGWNESRWEGTRIGEERSQHKKLPGGK